MIGVVDGHGEPRQLLVLLTDGRRVVVQKRSEQESTELRAPIAERLHPPHSGARSVVRWLRPVLPVDVELDGGRVRRVMPVEQE